MNKLLRQNSKGLVNLVTTLSLALSLGVPLLAIARDLESRRYPLPNHGSLELRVPGSWVHEIRQPPNRLPPTIEFRPKSGSPFQLLITTLWQASDQAQPLSAERVKQLVQNSANSIKPQAVEKTITLKEIIGTAGGGYYFSATDRAPGAGEYKYMTQGMLPVGGLLVTFTVLTNDGQQSVIDDALTALRTAVHNASI